jgi:hypothetical protein
MAVADDPLAAILRPEIGMLGEELGDLGSTAWVSKARAPPRKTSVSRSSNAPG